MILTAAAPYAIVKEADGLIDTVQAVNTALVTEGRKKALARIDGHLATLTKDLQTANADEALRSVCLGRLQSIRKQAETGESLAHLAQAEAEALKAYDEAIDRIEEYLRKPVAKDKPGEVGKASELSPPPVGRATQSNRMSPAGVVMFYGAADFETACVETVDPQSPPDKLVTGVVFRTARPVRLLDLLDLPEIPSFFDLEAEDRRRSLLFLRGFAADLAQPIRKDGCEHIEYVPTQAFTEYVRFEMKAANEQTIDGILYRSSKNGRPCYVLFCDQSHCVEGQSERWLEFHESSLRTETVASLLERGVVGKTA